MVAARLIERPLERLAAWLSRTAGETTSWILGVIGFLARRNLIIMFLCTEMMFQAAGIALIAFSKYHFNPDGEVFVIFVLTIAAAEAALALALVVLLFRRKETLDASAWAMLKG